MQTMGEESSIGGDSGDHVGCAGAAGGHGDADSAASARITIGHVGSALFVTHENVVELGFSERIVHGKNGAARVAEDVLDPEVLERLAEDFRAGEFHSVLPVEPVEMVSLCGKAVTAPREDEETRNAYLAMTPLVKRGAGAFQLARRR